MVEKGLLNALSALIPPTTVAGNNLHSVKPYSIANKTSDAELTPGK